MLKKVNVGNLDKSRDVLKTVLFIEKHVPRNSPILDAGAYASEVLCALHRLKYSDLTGVDLDPQIDQMPYANRIRYMVCDYMHTPFRDASFGAVTAISVIEHGFKSRELLQEISRILKPEGFFIVSFDYWQSKMDTGGIKAFGLDWTIFSEDETRRFIDEAKRFGLEPYGKMDFSTMDKTIEWNEREYTFAWLVLRKTKS